jgi:transcriptional regulator
MLLIRGRDGDARKAAELLGQALDTARELGLSILERRAQTLVEKASSYLCGPQPGE